jgi:hypothetical protein
LAFATAWALVACTTSEPPPPTVVDHFDLVANVPIAAAQLEVTRPVGTASVTVVALLPDVVVRMAEVGDRIHVVWLGPAAVAGPQVRLDVERAEGTTGGSVIVAASAYASSDGAEVGADAFAWRTVAGSGVLEAPEVPGPFPFGGMDLLGLAPSFADHPLGDLDANRVLDVRDALVWLDRVRNGNWTDYQRYHADFDVDDDADAEDLTELLDKLVDPTLPARLHVRPTALSFVELDPAPGEDAVVLVANRGREPFASLAWNVPAGVATATVGGIEDHSAAIRLTLAERQGWVPGFARVTDGTGGEAEVRVGHLVFLVAGQSNASGRGQPVTGWPEAPSAFVRALANDYRWKAAVEPLDVWDGQVDVVSADENAAYSFGTRLGHLLLGSTGFATYLIPAAKGATDVALWLPTANRLDRTTLFGSANYRAQVSASLVDNPVSAQPYTAEGGPVTAIVWFQGESDASTSTRRSNFVAGTDAVMDAFVAELGVPVIYVQLASHRAEQLNEQQLAIAELQRRMETGSGFAQARPAFHMVVAMDLPRSDQIHPSAYGQRVLAERIELAIREHVLGEDVDGTGPRLVTLRSTGLQVDVETTHVLAAGALDAGLFRVYDGAPQGSVDDIENYGQNAIPIVSVARHPTDPRTVRITLQSAPGGTPYVRYWARPTLVEEPAATWDDLAAGAVRADDGGLPLPGFGPIAVP